MVANSFTLIIPGAARTPASKAKTADLYFIKQPVAGKRMSAIEMAHFPVDPDDPMSIQSRLAPVNIASSVTLITAQRLARRLCACKTPDNIPPRGTARAAATRFTSGFAGSCRSRKRAAASSFGSNAIQVAEQARREGVRGLLGACSRSNMNDFAQGSHGLHLRGK
ncbi:MAG: hypothetical protein WBM28_15080 [Burkholderiales bacterium]